MKMEIRLALWIKRIVTRHRFGGVFSLRMCRNGAKILAVLTMAMMLMSPLTAYASGGRKPGWRRRVHGTGNLTEQVDARHGGREGDGHPGGYQDPGDTAH
mgnify:CR=1 FL=1